MYGTIIKSYVNNLLLLAFCQDIYVFIYHIIFADYLCDGSAATRRAIASHYSCCAGTIEDAAWKPLKLKSEGIQEEMQQVTLLRVVYQGRQQDSSSGQQATMCMYGVSVLVSITIIRIVHEDFLHIFLIEVWKVLVSMSLTQLRYIVSSYWFREVLLNPNYLCVLYI